MRKPTNEGPIIYLSCIIEDLSSNRTILKGVETYFKIFGYLCEQETSPQAVMITINFDNTQWVTLWYFK